MTIGSTQQLLATPRDAQGQALQDRPVTFQSDNPAVASVSVTGLVTAVAVGTTTIRATSEGRTGTSAITVTPRPASRLAFTTQPANGSAGQALPAIRVAVQDEQGGTIPDAVTTITLAIADNAGGATLSGTTTVNAVAGVATFNNVRLDKAGTGYTLRATAVPLTAATSTAFNIVAGPAARLLMVTQPPAAAQSGVPLAADPVVRIVDANGNAVAQAGVEISVQLVGTGATLAGDLSIATATNGTATFTGLVLTGSGSYSLRFLGSGLTEVVSTPIALASGVATGLMVLTQPSTSAQSNVPFAQQPVIQLRDDNNNPVAAAGVPITASIATGGGTLFGTATIATDAAGRAAFTNLRISGSAGARTLQFSSPGLALVLSNPITITAAPATKLGLTTQPSAAAPGGVAFAQQPVVQVQDADGNAVALPGVTVTATIESGPAGGTLGGTTGIVTSATGEAEFTNLSLTGPAGAYTLRFSARGLTHVVSTSITLGAGARDQARHHDPAVGLGAERRAVPAAAGDPAPGRGRQSVGPGRRGGDGDHPERKSGALGNTQRHHQRGRPGHVHQPRDHGHGRRPHADLRGGGTHERHVEHDHGDAGTTERDHDHDAALRGGTERGAARHPARDPGAG